MTKSYLISTRYHLPSTRLTNAQLADEFPEWNVDKIESKTGIAERRIAAEGECASDLAYEAGKKLLNEVGIDKSKIDFVLFCTQSPDYFLPTSACILQEKLGLSTTAGALDFNLGCSGYVYGLSMARALVESGQAKNVLLLVGETYSKFIHPKDKSVRTIFGDGAAASLISREAGDGLSFVLGEFLFGSDGAGAGNLIVPAGAARKPYGTVDETEVTDASGNIRTLCNLYMNGPEIFHFTMSAVPDALNGLYEKAGITGDDVDVFIFHQANKFMLDHLRKKMKIPKEKFIVDMNDVGNTVSATIPIALQRAIEKGDVTSGQTVALVGFGVGYSWSAGLMRS